MDLPKQHFKGPPMLVLRYIEKELTRLEHIQQQVWQEMTIGNWYGHSRYVVKYIRGILYPSRP